MKDHYTLTIPQIAGLDVRYYYQNTSQIDDARIFPPHVHDRLEFYVLIEGNASFMVEDHLYSLASGDVIVSRPNEIHNCILNERTVHKHLCFWFDSSSEFLLGDFLTRSEGSGALISPSPGEKERLADLYDEICSAGEEERPLKQMYVALEILDILRQNLSCEQPIVPFPPLLATILEDINGNFPYIRDLRYFTQKYFISQSTLGRMFRRHLQTTPRQYLETKRLAHSRRLLKEGKSVLDACMESGFTDCSHYISLFRRHFSVTPGQYRSGAVWRK